MRYLGWMVLILIGFIAGRASKLIGWWKRDYTYGRLPLRFHALHGGVLRGWLERNAGWENRSLDRRLQACR